MEKDGGDEIDKQGNEEEGGPLPPKRFKFKDRVWALLERVPPEEVPETCRADPTSNKRKKDWGREDMISKRGEENKKEDWRRREERNKRRGRREKIIAKENVPPKLPEESFEDVATLPPEQDAPKACEGWSTEISPERACSLFAEVLHLLPGYLSSSEFLRLREVCKVGKDFIDEILQNHETSTLYFESPKIGGSLKRIFEHLRRPFTLASLEEIGKFNKKFDNVRNPFISRTLAIQCNERMSVDNVLPFLQRFGVHVWHLKYDSRALTRFDPSNNESAEDLSRLLSNLPNLRSLSVYENDRDYFQRKLHVRVLSELKIHQFPPLLHLTRLSMKGGRLGLEFSLGEALLQRYGFQLTTLECSSNHLEQNSITPDLIRLQLPNLRNLRIHAVTKATLRKLSKLKGFPLERLQLINSSSRQRFKHVIKAINAFSSTLLQLRIIFPVKFPKSDGLIKRKLYEKLRLQFPCLVKLTVHLDNSSSPWFNQMVKLKFQVLEVLDFRLGKVQEKDEQFLKEEFKQFFEWLPKLNKIQFSQSNGRYVVMKPEV